MTTREVATPEWLLDEPVVLAVWDGRDEPSELVAARLLKTLESVNHTLGTAEPWHTPSGEVVALREPDLNELISAGVWTDDLGRTFPDQGYSAALVRESAELVVTVSVTAGARRPGRRIAANRVAVSLQARLRKGIAQRYVNETLRAVVSIWGPLSAAARDDAAAEASEGRGAWAPLVGQLTWVPNGLAAIRDLPPTVRAEPLADGVLLTSDETLDASRAVAAVCGVLARSGVTQIPRGSG